MRWSPNKSHETKILRSPRQFCGSTLNCFVLPGFYFSLLTDVLSVNCPKGFSFVLIQVALNACSMLLFVCVKKLVDPRSLVGGIGFYPDPGFESNENKMPNVSSSPWTTISTELDKLNSPWYSLHIFFVTKVLQSKRYSKLLWMISGKKEKKF